MLKAAEPACFLLPARVLRRVINHDRGSSRFGLRVPHYRSYVVPRDHLLQTISLQELGISPDCPLPPTVILIASPSASQLAGSSRETMLLTYWRILFHAQVHAALEQRLADRGTTGAHIATRVDHIGRTEFEEIRSVLWQDRYLLSPTDDQAVYVEFAAVYLELRHFAASRLPHYFPGLSDFQRIESILAEDVAAEELYTSSRLAGIPTRPSRPGRLRMNMRTSPAPQPRRRRQTPTAPSDHSGP